jgi:hypothetical protein
MLVCVQNLPYIFVALVQTNTSRNIGLDIFSFYLFISCKLESTCCHVILGWFAQCVEQGFGAIVISAEMSTRVVNVFFLHLLFNHMFFFFWIYKHHHFCLLPTLVLFTKLPQHPLKFLLNYYCEPMLFYSFFHITFVLLLLVNKNGDCRCLPWNNTLKGTTLNSNVLSPPIFLHFLMFTMCFLLVFFVHL